MTYATLLLHLGDDPRIDAVTALALGLARRFESHVVALASSGVRDSQRGGVESAFSAVYAGIALEQLHDAAQARGRGFETLARRAAHDDYEVAIDDDDVAQALLRRARTADLVVLAQPDPAGDDWPRRRSLLEQAILGIAAPCLVVPYAGDFADAGKRVLVAWNDSRECARAVLAALPLLRRASEVHLLQVVSPDEAGQASATPPLQAATRWLERHGVRARASVEAVEIDFGNALLSRAADLGVDLIVAGAWSHSRLAESLFGGVTRTLLASMTVPLLTVH